MFFTWKYIEIMFFYLLKFIFDISTSKKSKNTKKIIWRTKNHFFCKRAFQPQKQTRPIDSVWNWGWTCFSSKIEFFLLQIIFLMFLDRFDVLMSKIIFLFLKKTLFWCISKRKALWKTTSTILPNTPLIKQYETSIVKYRKYNSEIKKLNNKHNKEQ